MFSLPSASLFVLAKQSRTNEFTLATVVATAGTGTIPVRVTLHKFANYAGYAKKECEMEKRAKKN